MSETKVTVTLVTGRTQAISLQQPSISLQNPGILGLVDEGGAAREEFELRWGTPRITLLRLSSEKFRIYIIKRKDGRDGIFGEVIVKTSSLSWDKEASYDILRNGDKVGHIVLFFSKKGKSPQPHETSTSAPELKVPEKFKEKEKKKSKEKISKKDKKKKEEEELLSPRGGGGNGGGNGKEQGGLNELESVEIARNLLKKGMENRKYKSSSGKVTSKLKEFSTCGGVDKMDLSEMGLNLLPGRGDYPTLLHTCVNHIDASFNPLVMIPDLSIFVNLSILELNGNKLTRVSALIGLCVNLTELSIIGSEVESISAHIRNCSRLEKVNVSNNKLQRLDLSGLSKMDDLVVSGNQLKAIPWGMKSMPLLTCFDISDNQLSHLSSDICSCNKLIELKISNNQLSSLPPDIGKLSRCEHLLLADNKLKELPVSIGKLPLAYIDISRNPIQDPKIFEKWKLGTDHLSNYLELRMDLARSDQRSKQERDPKDRKPKGERPSSPSKSRDRPRSPPGTHAPKSARGSSPSNNSPSKTRSRSPPTSRPPPSAGNKSSRSRSPQPQQRNLSPGPAPPPLRGRSKTHSASDPPPPNLSLASSNSPPSSPSYKKTPRLPHNKSSGGGAGSKLSLPSTHAPFASSGLASSEGVKLGAGGVGAAPAGGVAGLRAGAAGGGSFASPRGTGSSSAIRVPDRTGTASPRGGTPVRASKSKPLVQQQQQQQPKQIQPQQQQKQTQPQPPQPQQTQKPQPQQQPQPEKMEQIKRVVGLCRENILASKATIQLIHNNLLKCTTIQELMKVAGGLKQTRETYKDIKQITPENLCGTQTANVPTTPYGEQFNSLLKTLVILCCEMVNVLVGLMQFISSMTRDYLNGGNASHLRLVAQAGKLTRDFAQQLAQQK